MTTYNRRLTIFFLGLVSFVLSPAGFAVVDKDNQGRWNSPAAVGPDKEVPGFLVNLGPTGARAALTEKTFIVQYIFKGSPAVDKLLLGDEIIGAFGKPFSSHRFGNSFGPHGYEGPILDLGNAIEQAEGKDGKLLLNVSRSAKMIEITIKLEVLGAFSPTFPIKCKKSELVRTKALSYLAENQAARESGPDNAYSAVCLALLTSDDPKQQEIGKQMALKNSQGKADPKAWSWYLSIPLITLGEYYLMSKDASVLPKIKDLVECLEKTQFMGKIIPPPTWGEHPDGTWQLCVGGFGHAPYVAGGPRVYGPMQLSTTLAVIGWQLAGRCGVNVKPDHLKCALDFIHRGTNASGHVTYGQEMPPVVDGYIDLLVFTRMTGGDNYVGRSGAALIAHKLSPEMEETPAYLAKYRSYFKTAYKSLPDGHADPNLGILWGLMGAGAAEDDSVLRVVFDYHKAYFNMSRCFDGSFVLQPGRDYADDGYYMGAGSTRFHPTATMVLALGLNNPKLHIQGIQVSIPGVNPKALIGKLDAAYKAIVTKNYGQSAAAIKSARSVKTISDSDAAICTAMSNYLDTQSLQSFSELEILEKNGDFLGLQSAVARNRANFGLLEGFKEKIQHYDEGLQQDDWKAQIKLGARYVQLVNAMKNKPNQTKAKDLDTFAEKNPESLYGKWAAEVAKVYREEKRVFDPSALKNPAPVAPAAKPTK